MPLAATTEDAALVWIHHALAECGLEAAGEPEQVHVTAWSIVSRVPTGQGTVWFKENGPGAAYEPALIRALGTWVPERVLVPLAVDTEHGWSLCPDGGRTLRSLTADGEGDLGRWEEMLSAYAELQRALTPRTDELLSLGVPDMRPERMPGRLRTLLDDPLVWAGLSTDEYEALRHLEPEYARWCVDLEDSGIPVSLQHEDLHDANVFAERDRDGAGGGYRFFDWGDSSVAHPFASLLIALRAAVLRFRLPIGDPSLVRLRDAYLEPWTATARPRAELIEIADTAVRVAKVGRALAWQRALLGTGPDARKEHGDAVPRWVAELLEPDVL